MQYNLNISFNGVFKDNISDSVMKELVNEVNEAIDNIISINEINIPFERLYHSIHQLSLQSKSQFLYNSINTKFLNYVTNQSKNLQKKQLNNDKYAQSVLSIHRNYMERLEKVTYFTNPIDRHYLESNNVSIKSKCLELFENVIFNNEDIRKKLLCTMNEIFTNYRNTDSKLSVLNALIKIISPYNRSENSIYMHYEEMFLKEFELLIKNYLSEIIKISKPLEFLEKIDILNNEINYFSNLLNSTKQKINNFFLEYCYSENMDFIINV